MAIKCRLWYDCDLGGYYMSVTEKNQRFIDSLERFIPQGDREFDRTKNFYVITERFFDPVKNLAELVWNKPGEVHVITKAEAEKQQLSAIGSDLDIACVQFCRLLPFDAASSAYKRAAAALHPDKNEGNSDQMTRLNVVWTKLKKELYKQ